MKEANSPDYVISGYTLGPCFDRVVDGEHEMLGGLCLNEDVPLSFPVELVDGASYQKTFGGQVVESGEERILEHTFTFTVTEPGVIAVIPTSQTLDTNLSSPGFENRFYTLITFK